MNVDSIGSHRYPALDGGRPGRSHQIEDGADEVRKKTQSQATIGEPPVTDELEPTEGEDTEETQEAKGVLRLLQEGHFKGVADIRLRINFSEELAGAELPELSAARGNGRAYQKFLEIYRGMQNTDDVETPDNPNPGEPPEGLDPVETPEDSELIDVVA